MKSMGNFDIGHGRSSSFFFNTEDSRFIIKTIKQSERKVFTEVLLKKYHAHLCENSDTLLARVYGIFTIKIRY